ncbi:Histone deacetylase complex subunit [Tilletia horrida]|uniref:Histone deacetylase complex subunit n=1 Tax=Tilletia horrida TaxID=155126 RepID=A0AAN6GV83_9BASI|nr:Histone deacetylase complex subunit [Tilletia horrida]KAK0556964.1 Histone deacetylase complex subunit [Tilletia horrida]KAK0566658.1 Histone deacetylase complex subunit [Tilletia horrida]
MSDVDTKKEAGEPTKSTSKPKAEDTTPAAATASAPTQETAEEEEAAAAAVTAAAPAATDAASSDTVTAADAAADPTPTEAPPTESESAAEADAEEIKDENNADEEPEPVLPRRSRRAAFDLATQQETDQGRTAQEDGTPDEEMAEDQYDNAEADGGDEGVTRCVCGSTDENVGLMIQCEECKAWQHCICMGMEYEEECPDVYFCEQCKPELHIPLLKSLGVLKENGAFGNYKANGASGKKGIIMGPNGKPSKNPARDQARELREAKEAVARLAQENAQRHREAAAAAEQEAAVAAGGSSKDRKGSYDRSRKRSESRDVDAGAGASSASSAAALAGLKSPKRRSTMNSRDSAYGWEPIPPGLLNDDEVWEDGPNERNSRKRQRSIKEEGEEDGSDDDLQPPEQLKRRRLSSSKPLEEPEAIPLPRSHKKKSKAKGKVPDDPNAPPRPKHPNQYTYRPKVRPAEATAPSKQDAKSDDIARGGTPALGRAVSPTPSPSKARDRRGANSNSRTGTPTPNTNPGGPWILPDHLWSLAHYLPSPAPIPLTIHVPSTKGISRTAVAAERERLLASKNGSSSDAVNDRATPQPYNVIDLTEAPSRVKFPGRRMTMGEMRKRVRLISEFVTRMQLEAVERGRRTSALGIKVGGGLAWDPFKMGLGSSSAGAAGTSTAPAHGASSTEAPMEVDAQEEVPAGSSTTEGQQSTDTPTAGPSSGPEAPSAETPNEVTSSNHKVANPNPTATSTGGSQTQLPQSMVLLEALTAELVAFQRKFGISGQGVPPTLASSLSVASAMLGTATASAVNSATLATASSSSSSSTNAASGLGLDLGIINNNAVADA